MAVWTPAERRGALLLVVLLSLGAARDLWRATHPDPTPPPAEPQGVTGGPATSGPAAGGDGPPPAVPGRTAAPLVDINRAGLAELDALPGIGPVLAGRILRHRQEHGPFREPDDLLAVPGIGPRLLERLRPHVVASVAADGAPHGVAIGNPAARERVQIPVQKDPGHGR